MTEKQLKRLIPKRIPPKPVIRRTQVKVIKPVKRRKRSSEQKIFGRTGKLSMKKAVFIEKLMQDPDMNISQAAQAAEMCVKNPSAVLKTKSVREEMQAYKEDREERVDVEIDRIVCEMACIGFSDPREVFTADGSLKPITSLSRNTAACISSVQVREFYDPKTGELTGVARKITFWDKNAALRMMGQYKGMFIDRRVDMSVQLDKLLTGLPEQVREVLVRKLMTAMGNVGNGSGNNR